MICYPARATVRTFGGFTAMNRAMGAPITTIANWCKGKDGPDPLIPRWWTPIIEAAAKERGLALPKPKTAKSLKRHRRPEAA